MRRITTLHSVPIGTGSTLSLLPALLSVSNCLHDQPLWDYGLLSASTSGTFTASGSQDEPSSPLLSDSGHERSLHPAHKRRYCHSRDQWRADTTMAHRESKCEQGRFQKCKHRPLSSRPGRLSRSACQSEAREAVLGVRDFEHAKCVLVEV